MSVPRNGGFFISEDVETPHTKRTAPSRPDQKKPRKGGHGLVSSATHCGLGERGGGVDLKTNSVRTAELLGSAQVGGERNG